MYSTCIRGELHRCISVYFDALLIEIIYFNSSEANDLALQIAEAYTGHSEVIVIEGSVVDGNDGSVIDHPILSRAYHGHTAPLMGLSSYKAHQVTTSGSYSKNPHAWFVSYLFFVEGSGISTLLPTPGALSRRISRNVSRS